MHSDQGQCSPICVHTSENQMFVFHHSASLTKVTTKRISKGKTWLQPLQPFVCPDHNSKQFSKKRFLHKAQEEHCAPKKNCSLTFFYKKKKNCNPSYMEPIRTRRICLLNIVQCGLEWPDAPRLRPGFQSLQRNTFWSWTNVFKSRIRANQFRKSMLQKRNVVKRLEIQWGRTPTRDQGLHKLAAFKTARHIWPQYIIHSLNLKWIQTRGGG